jgi:two-component system sensor histidine kinase QseC
MSGSLQRRLLLLALGATIAVWIAATLWTWRSARHEIDELLDAHLAQAAALLVARSAGELEEIDVEHAPVLDRHARKVAFQVWERGRSLRLHSANAPNEPLGTRQEGYSERVIEGRGWRVFSAWDARREMLIHVGERADVRGELSAELAQSLLWPLLLALPALALLLSLAIRGGLRPLLGLSEQVARRDSENLAALDEQRVPAEAQPLVRQLNGLFERMRDSLERERRFTADAAHELRTPVAGIKAQAQVARMASSEAGRTRALEQVIAGADRAGRLVDQLLTLARLEAADANEYAPHTLRAIASQALADVAPLAATRGVELELADGADAQVPCQPMLLEVLLRNLLHNAIVHGGGRVRVSIDSSADATVLSVEDQGPGVAPEERDKVQQRFYRLEGAHEGGSGLGLSIVQRIAQLHHATLALSQGSGGKGLRVVVRFPSPPTPL